MTTKTTADLEDFAAFLHSKIEDGGAGLTPEQVLAQWRERVNTIEAVRQGIEAVDQGRTKSLEQFTRDFHARHDIPEEA